MRKLVVSEWVTLDGVATTEGKTVRSSLNAPNREGWVAVTPLPYPDEQEED